MEHHSADEGKRRSSRVHPALPHAQGWSRSPQRPAVMCRGRTPPGGPSLLMWTAPLKPLPDQRPLQSPRVRKWTAGGGPSSQGVSEAIGPCHTQRLSSAPMPVLHAQRQGGHCLHSFPTDREAHRPEVRWDLTQHCCPRDAESEMAGTFSSSLHVRHQGAVWDLAGMCTRGRCPSRHLAVEGLSEEEEALETSPVVGTVQEMTPRAQ